jgi:hypothetical protein
MPGVKEFAVAFGRAQVVPIGSQADVAIGAHHEQCDALDPKETGSDGFEPSDLIARLGPGAEGEGRFEQRRVGGELLQSGVKLHERRIVCGRAAQQHEGVPRRRPVKPLPIGTSWPSLCGNGIVSGFPRRRKRQQARKGSKHQELFTQVYYKEIRFEQRPDYCNTPIQTGNKNPLARNHADTRRA